MSDCLSYDICKRKDCPCEFYWNQHMYEDSVIKLYLSEQKKKREQENEQRD